MTSLELKNVKISTIQPSEKTHHTASLNVTLLDLIALDVYLPIVLFYKPNQEESVPGNLISRMKASLSKVLVPYFPFAGRWVKTYDSRFRELLCTDEGVPFIEAYVDQELNSVLNNGDFQSNPQLASLDLVGLDPKPLNQTCDIPMPALIIQATQFKCGGVALNVIVNHMTADGHSLVTFMTAWSQIAMHGETSIVPNHDRSLIFSREAFGELAAAAFGPPPQEELSNVTTSKTNETIPSSEPEKERSKQSNGSVQCSDLQRTDPAKTSKTNETIPSSEPEERSKQSNGSVQCSELQRTDPAAVHRLPGLEALKSKFLHVKREAIESLKREAAEEKLDVTTLDLITAHVWRCLYNLPATKKKTSGASVATYVEGRRRFHDLPKHYFGNVVVLASTPPTPPAQMSSYSQPFAASIVHSAVQGLNPSTWKDYMLNASKASLSFTQLNYTQYFVTSWYRFPMYEISFDSDFGNPIYAAWNCSSPFLPLGLAIVMPPPPRHSRDIIATLQFYVVESNGTPEALFSDPEFMSFFHSSELAL